MNIKYRLIILQSLAHQKKTETVEDKASPEEKRMNQSSTPPNIASQKAYQNESGTMGGPAYRVDEGKKLELRVAIDRQSASPNTPATKGLQSKAQDHPTNPGRTSRNYNTGQMKDTPSKPSHPEQPSSSGEGQSPEATASKSQ